MKKISVHKVIFTSEMLSRVPDCQRVVLVYSGHISNEINWFNKINLILQQSSGGIADKLAQGLSPQERAFMDGNATQTLIHTRLFAGKLHEATLFLKRWCFDMPWFEDACEQMESEGKTAVARIRSHIEQIEKGTKVDLLRLVRNKFGFHYDDKAVKSSSRVPDSLENFATYLADSVGNSLYLGSEFAVTGYLIEKAEIGDARKTIENLADETMDLARDINKVLGHTFSVICVKYFGMGLLEASSTEHMELECQSMEELALPFFTVLAEKENG